MKGHNIAVYIIILLVLFSIMSSFDNVQAELTQHHLPIKRHLNNNNSKIKTQMSLRRFNENRYSCIKEYFDERPVSNS